MIHTVEGLMGLFRSTLDRAIALAPTSLQPTPNMSAEFSILRAYAAALALPPHGWKLVPIEPTEEMWTAGRDPILYRDMSFKVPSCMEAPPWRINPTTGKVEKDQSKGTTAVHVYRAMLAASPLPEAP